jgi:quercetin dioxygenase-like cupin family protein
MAEAIVVRDGEGESIAPWLVKAAGRQTEDRFDFLVGSVDYCSGPPLHVHAAQDDSFYVLEGVLAVQSGDEVFDLHAGDFVSFPPGVWHTFDNLIEDQPPVRAINLMTHGGYDAALVEFAKMDASLDMEAANKLVEEHGVVIVGPPIHVKLGLR